MRHDTDNQRVWQDELELSFERVGVHSPPIRAGLIPMQFFQEIRDYIGFDEANEAELISMHELVSPHFEAIVEAFYVALWENPRTRMVFSGPEQVERLRKTLIEWLDQIFSGPFDEAYFKKRMIIGKVHVDVGLLPHFMFGAMNVIRRYIIELIIEDESDLARRRKRVQAVERILDMELTIMVQSYWDVMMDQKLQMPTALATGLAHEIRNPLNSLNLNVTLMERRLQKLEADTSGVEPVLEVMRSEIRRIKGLTSEIMDFAKPVAIRPDWYDARELIQDILVIHEPTLEVSNIALETECSEDARIWCDIDRIKQILVNLMTNSIEAIGEHGTISLSIVNEKQGTRIIFADDGEGMEVGMRYKIFDLFYTTKAAGTGLGLPIVSKIIDAHDGALDVISHKGQGTTFTIFLPRPRQSS